MADAQRLSPEGRVVMISGASRGIGLAIAKRLHEDGYVLSLGVRRPGAGTFADFDPTRTLVHRFEAEDAITASAWVDATAARFGRIDGLVNNAGMLRPLDLRSGDESVLDEMWAVNVKAPFRLIRLALPHLEKGGRGRIVNVDVTLICEAPKIKPHREAMRARIAELLGLPPDLVSVKATTTEGLGFAGRREGIAAQAVASVEV